MSFLFVAKRRDTRLDCREAGYVEMVSGGCKRPGGFGELFDHGQEESTWGRAREVGGSIAGVLFRARGGGPSSIQIFCVSATSTYNLSILAPKQPNIIVCTFALDPQLCENKTIPVLLSASQFLIKTMNRQ